MSPLRPPRFSVHPAHLTFLFHSLGGINASGQVPEVVGNFGLIDSDTPEEARSIVTQKGETWELVFSDEFNTPGRTFWPGGEFALLGSFMISC